ncbi:MAG: LOG family protein [Candidatus Kerfeldbacteria bacterium]|nr:LOG family protein [Candidatus Kerfeldbacteria bacterium]
MTQRKRRALGELLQPAELRTGNAWVSIESSSKDLLLTYKSRGLVVAVSGGGSVSQNHTQARAAAALATAVAKRNGIILTGGRDEGITKAIKAAAAKNVLGIIFPELKKELAANVATAIVNAPTPRIELLATCAPVVVVFRGGLGTLMVLMRTIVHQRNRTYHPDQPEQLVFVSNYWLGILTTLMNMGALPREFLSSLQYFDQTEQILRRLPPD